MVVRPLLFRTISMRPLVPGGVYRVTQRFTDCRGAIFEPGDTFTYHYTSYWAYDDAITLNCAGAHIDFLKDDNADLIENFATYIEKIGQTDAPAPPTQAPLVASQTWNWWEILGSVFLVVGSVYIVATERPRFSGAYVSAWVILAIAVCWGGYLAMQWLRRK